MVRYIEFQKRKLDDELQGKLSTELSEMIKKSNAYVKEMQESNRHYWEQQLKRTGFDAEFLQFSVKALASS